MFLNHSNQMQNISKNTFTYFKKFFGFTHPEPLLLTPSTGFILCSLLLLSGHVTAAGNGHEALKSPAADFTLKSNTGENIRLEELAGQVVFINFWASWCGPCRKELPELEELYQRYKDLGFIILAISNDSDKEKARKFFEPLNLSYPILFDNNQNVSGLYRVKAMPSSFLVDREGFIRYQHKGFNDGFIERYDAEIRELVKE